MSSRAESSEQTNETPLDELCEEILEDDEFSDEVQRLAEGLLEAVEEGRLDATR